MSKKDIRKKHQGYVNSIVSKLTKLFVFLFLFCALPAAAQPALEAEQFSSETCSREFKRLFYRAEFIISKGQGNYEALSGQHRPIFFMLKAKCTVVAADLGVALGGIILKGISA